jgi:hypothetical protein
LPDMVVIESENSGQSQGVLTPPPLQGNAIRRAGDAQMLAVVRKTNGKGSEDSEQPCGLALRRQQGTKELPGTCYPRNYARSGEGTPRNDAINREPRIT